MWSYGHRNPQGLVVDPRDHMIYETEHGLRGGDEFNRIRKGANYGWPLVCFGMNYNGTPLTALTQKEGIEPPLHHWRPSIGTCGLAFLQRRQISRFGRTTFSPAGCAAACIDSEWWMAKSPRRKSCSKGCGACGMCVVERMGFFMSFSTTPT